MLVVALCLFVGSLIAVWGALFVLTRNIDTLNEIVPVSAHAEYSVTEAFFSRVENLAGDLHSKSAKTFYKTVYNLLSRFLPWFRNWTRGTEKRLQEIVSTVKGKKDLSGTNPENTSQFIKDIKAHAENSGDGRIHEG